MTMTAAEIARRFKRKPNGREYRGACPSCGYPTGFAVTEGRAGPVWWCASCQDKAALTEVILGTRAAAAPGERRSPSPDPDKLAAPRRGFANSGPVLPDNLAGAYLATRLPGVSLPPDLWPVLRFLPDASHPSRVRLPAMVAAVRDVAGNLTAIHRTFLAPPGIKAAIEPQRASLGAVAGGAVRLWPVAAELVVGEGIETSLAAAHLLHLPAWAAVSAGNLADAMKLPAEVRAVVIAADHDPPGIKAARAAAARWRQEGRRVRIATPDRAGADFADMVAERRSRPA
jgi:putative DNA primase/helicase